MMSALLRSRNSDLPTNINNAAFIRSGNTCDNDRTLDRGDAVDNDTVFGPKRSENPMISFIDGKPLKREAY